MYVIANKFMAKYQRPCCILTKVEEEKIEAIETYNPSAKTIKYNAQTNTSTEESGGIIMTMTTTKNISYQGSARGCDRVGVTEFKDICAETGLPLFVAGHQGAFGLSLREQDIQAFLNKTNDMLKNMSNEAIYFVDYIYNGTNINAQNILDIADMNEFWGKDFEESFVAIENLKVTKDMVTLMSPDKSPTLKIMLPNKISIIKFGSSQEEYNKIAQDGYIEMNIVGKCNKNEWNGNISAQILLEDYEIIDSNRYFF